MALPWMECMAPALARGSRLEKPPMRCAFIFMPNGVVPEDWSPEGDGESYETTPMLKPFVDLGLKDDFLLLENLWNENSVGRNGHWPKVPAWLAGGVVESGAVSKLNSGGTSVDQVMARHLGNRTALPSLQLGIDPPAGGIDTIGGGFPKMLGAHISWRDPHTPAAREIEPQRAFDRLFGKRSTPRVAGQVSDSEYWDQSLSTDDASILDAVLEDANSLKRRISRHDRGKLEEYLESVRSVERGIRNTFKPQKRWVNETRMDMARPPSILPETRPEHLKLMLDIMLLALWTDSTRISSIMLGNAASGVTFEFLEGVGKRTFHTYSHHLENPEMKLAYRRICLWYIQQAAYLLARMKALDEGGTSLLDNSMVLFGSTLKDGNRHLEKDLPTILAGRGQGTLKPGRRVRAPEDTPLCNLHCALLDRMGVASRGFGDSTGSLPGLG